MGGLFVALTGAPLKHVPYRGSSGAAQDLVAGIVESSFAAVPNALAQVPAGRLRALAVTTAKRAPQLPDVPTMQEAGVPGYNASVWLALLAPAGTPPGIVKRLNGEVAKALAEPDTKKALFDAGVEPTPSTPEEMAAYMTEELARWGKVVKEAGIKVGHRRVQLRHAGVDQHARVGVVDDVHVDRHPLALREQVGNEDGRHRDGLSGVHRALGTAVIMFDMMRPRQVGARTAAKTSTGDRPDAGVPRC